MKQEILAAVALLSMCGAAAARQIEKDGLVIDHVWTRATPEGAKAGAGYLTITNKGKETDRLTGGTFADADEVQVHEMKKEGDKMTMRQLKDGIEIKPGDTVKLAPGGYHLMFIGLKKPIAKGENIKGALSFEKAGNVDVDYKAEGIGAMKSSGEGAMKPDDSKMMHDHMQ